MRLQRHEHVVEAILRGVRLGQHPATEHVHQSERGPHPGEGQEEGTAKVQHARVDLGQPERRPGEQDHPDHHEQAERHVREAWSGTQLCITDLQAITVAISA